MQVAALLLLALLVSINFMVRTQIVALQVQTVLLGAVGSAMAICIDALISWGCVGDGPELRHAVAWLHGHEISCLAELRYLSGLHRLKGARVTVALVCA